MIASLTATGRWASRNRRSLLVALAAALWGVAGVKSWPVWSRRTPPPPR